MVITTNGRNYSAVSSTNKINNESNINNTTLSIFEKLIDQSKATDTKTSDYYVNSNTSSTPSVTYEKPSQVKWEDQLVYPNMKYEYDPGAYEAYENSQSYDPIGYEWITQLRTATNGNKYEDAPEFEAFVKKWMDKGESEDQALGRATLYARAGLLDYGKERAISIGNNLPYGDIKQHGFHLINNEPLKNAVLKTLDSLNGGDAADLVSSIFEGFPENKGVPSSFQELLDNFGIKLEELKKLNPETAKNDKFTFTGDINLKDGIDSKEYNNFIFDTLIKFFKDRIEKLDYVIENKPPEESRDFHELRDGLNSLIDNLKKEVDVYNNGFLENQAIDNQGK
jgi:hypothetical protein